MKYLMNFSASYKMVDKVGDFSNGQHLTTHSTGARVSLALIVNLSHDAVVSRPVNSGVRYF